MTSCRALVLTLALAGSPVFAQEAALPRLGQQGQVPFDKVASAYRSSCRDVVEKPTLYSQGPIEIFGANPSLYTWLLDHPDRAMMAWKRLGAKCTSIVEKKPGTFVWTDSMGSEVRWCMACREANLCIWYAEGKVRPNLLFPLVPVQAVVLMRHKERQETERTYIGHQFEVYLHLPGRTAAAATRLLGPSAPKLAEQGLGQLGMFFSGLAWYLEQHPDRAPALLASVDPKQSGERIPGVK